DQGFVNRPPSSGIARELTLQRPELQHRAERPVREMGAKREQPQSQRSSLAPWRGGERPFHEAPVQELLFARKQRQQELACQHTRHSDRDRHVLCQLGGACFLRGASRSAPGGEAPRLSLLDPPPGAPAPAPSQYDRSRPASRDTRATSAAKNSASSALKVGDSGRRGVASAASTFDRAPNPRSTPSARLSPCEPRLASRSKRCRRTERGYIPSLTMGKCSRPSEGRPRKRSVSSYMSAGAAAKSSNSTSRRCSAGTCSYQR